MIDAAKEEFGAENTGTMKPNMAGEDFSYYFKEIPGAFCFGGAGHPNHSLYPHYPPRFQVDESVFPLAPEWIYRLI